MNQFIINSNEYLRNNTNAYYHTDYVGYEGLGNPDYLNDLKNTFNDFSDEKLNNAATQLYRILNDNLSQFDNSYYTICIVPRSKAENSYCYNQLLFKKVIQKLIRELGFQDGSEYIVRHSDTITTHLSRTQYAGNGDMPYPGITNATCDISSNVAGKNILLIDDIYTNGVNIDEDVIQSLYENGANLVTFYAVGKTR